MREISVVEFSTRRKAIIHSVIDSGGSISICVEFSGKEFVMDCNEYKIREESYNGFTLIDTTSDFSINIPEYTHLIRSVLIPESVYNGLIGAKACDNHEEFESFVTNSETHTNHGLHIQYIDNYYDRTQGRYSFIGQAIHDIKYHNQQSKFAMLVGILEAELESLINDVDLIIPVPSSSEKTFVKDLLSETKFAHLICDCIYKNRELPTVKDMKSKQDRIASRKNAYIISDNTDLWNKRVLLFDDMVDSGATLNEVAKTIRLHEKRTTISALVLARTYTCTEI